MPQLEQALEPHYCDGGSRVLRLRNRKLAVATRRRQRGSRGSGTEEQRAIGRRSGIARLFQDVTGCGVLAALCVRTRERCQCNEDEAFIEVATLLMSVKSYFAKRQVRWDKAKEEIV